METKKFYTIAEISNLMDGIQRCEANIMWAQENADNEDDKNFRSLWLDTVETGKRQMKEANETLEAINKVITDEEINMIIEFRENGKHWNKKIYIKD